MAFKLYYFCNSFSMESTTQYPLKSFERSGRRIKEKKKLKDLGQRLFAENGFKYNSDNPNEKIEA